MCDVKGRRAQVDSLISVIVPVYNVEKYLEKCIDSIVNQTFDHLEIILVNDGSTDHSLEICEKYKVQDKRIKVIDKKNGGLSDARNVGTQVAMGKFITFVDSDDFIDSDMITYLYHLITQADADISICQHKEIDEKSGMINKYLSVSAKTIVGNDNCMEAFFTNRGIGTIAWGKLYKKELFNGIRYPKGKFHEDVFTTYLLIARSRCIVIGNQHKYNYLLRRNSISKSSFQLKHLDAIEANKVRSEFIKKNYPKCEVYANAGIIYATNCCTIRLIKAMKSPVKIVDELQKNYRDYELDFLRGKSSYKAKIFSLIAYINLNLFMKTGIYLRIFWLLGKKHFSKMSYFFGG